MSDAASKKSAVSRRCCRWPNFWSSSPPRAPPCLVEPGLLPPQGILFVGGEPKVGKSLLVANLALSLAAGSDRTGFSIPAAAPRLDLPVRTSRPAVCRPPGRHAASMGTAADHNLLVDTRATGHLLCAPQGMNHFLAAAKAAAAEVIILDPLYSTHDQDENDTRCHGGAVPVACCACAMLRGPRSSWCIMSANPSRRYEIGSAFRGSSALHAVGDSYMLLTRPSPQLPTVELRFQFRYAAAQPPRLLATRSADSVVFLRRPAARHSGGRPAQSGESRRHASADGHRRAGALYPTARANHGR